MVNEMEATENFTLAVSRQPSIIDDEGRCSVTVSEVISALYTAGRANPEYADLAAIASNLLVRLDTIRDEVALRAKFGSADLAGGQADRARQALASIERMCGKRRRRFDLEVREKRPAGTDPTWTGV